LVISNIIEITRKGNQTHDREKKKKIAGRKEKRK
jgi:hypothetical protein